jgi:hypothetical protein
LGEYLDSWLTDSVKDTVRQRTYERYESIVRVHLKPALDRVRLDSLSPNHVRRLYRQKLDSGLAPRTVNDIHVTLHKALKDAVSDAIIPRNAASVRAPRPEKPEIHPLSPEQARKLIATARETEDRFEALLRPGPPLWPQRGRTPRPKMGRYRPQRARRHPPSKAHPKPGQDRPHLRKTQKRQGPLLKVLPKGHASPGAPPFALEPGKARRGSPLAGSTSSSRPSRAPPRAAPTS